MARPATCERHPYSYPAPPKWFAEGCDLSTGRGRTFVEHVAACRALYRKFAGRTVPSGAFSAFIRFRQPYWKALDAMKRASVIVRVDADRGKPGKPGMWHVCRLPNGVGDLPPLHFAGAVTNLPDRTVARYENHRPVWIEIAKTA